MDLKQICRTCLQTNKHRFDMYKSYYTEDNILYADMLCNNTKLKPREDDGLPRLICKDCVKQLKRAYLFNKQCEDSNEKLRSYIERKEFTVADMQNEHFNENKAEDDTIYNDDKFLVSLLNERTEGSYKKDVKTEPIAVDNDEDNEMYWASENVLLKEVKSKEILDIEMCQLPGPSRESSDEDEVSDSTKSESDDEEAPPGNQAQRNFWQFVNTFSNVKDAEDFVNAEDTWSKKSARITKEGKRSYYRCNKVKFVGPQCAAQLLCVYRRDEVFVYRKYAEHNHDDIGKRSRRGIQELTKSRIDKLFNMNLKARDILDSLKLNMDGIELPSKTQLYHYLSSKKRLTSDNPAPITLSELPKWISERERVPADENEPFVMKHQLMKVGQRQPMFRFALTTKKLLGLACSVDVLHSNSSGELTWQGFPILTVGMSDRKRKFFPLCLVVATDERREDFELIFSALKETIEKLFEHDFRPKVLVSDGTRAIGDAFSSVFGADAVVRVCWSHARRNIQRELEKTVKKIYRNPILQDVDELHKASSPVVFHNASRAFTVKYAKHSAFVEYFERMRVAGDRNWFLGAAPLSPVANDALEALNKSIKDRSTSRERLPFSSFMMTVCDMIGEWSNRIETAVCSGTTNIQLVDWTEGIRWATEDIPTKVLLSDDRTTTYLVSNKKDNSNFDNIGSWETFDEYKDRFFTTSKITLVKLNWKKSTCTCPKFFEKYVCKHILGLAIRLKLVTPPLIIPVSQLKRLKRKRVPSAERDVIILD